MTTTPDALLDPDGDEPDDEHQDEHQDEPLHCLSRPQQAKRRALLAQVHARNTRRCAPPQRPWGVR